MIIAHRPILNKLNTFIGWGLCISPLFFLFDPTGFLATLKLNPLELWVVLLCCLAGIWILGTREYSALRLFFTPLVLMVFFEILSGLVNQIGGKHIFSPTLKYLIYFSLYPALIALYITDAVWLKRFLFVLLAVFVIGSLHGYLDLAGIHSPVFEIITGSVQTGLLAIILPLAIYYLPKQLWVFLALLIFIFLIRCCNPHPSYFILLALITMAAFHFLPSLVQRIIPLLTTTVFILIDMVGVKSWLLTGMHYWKIILISIFENFTSAFDAFLQAPLLGVSTINAPAVISRYYTFDPAMLPFSEAVRSLYASLGIELGIIGLLGFLAIMGYFFRLFQKRNTPGNTRNFIFIALFWSFLLCSLFIDYSQRNHLFLMSITLGLIISLLHMKRSGETHV